MDLTGEALLRAVIAQPDDDLPRLIFADYLEESGDGARGSFIRLQIRIAQFVPPIRGEECTDVSASWCPNCGDCSCRDRAERMDDPGCPLHAPDSLHAETLDALRGRERELLVGPDGQCCRCNWHAPLLHGIGEGPRGAWTYRRGFIDSVSLPWNPAHLDAVLGVQPVSRVVLTTAPPNERWQFDSSGMMVRLEGRRWHYERDMIDLGRRLYPDRETADVRILLLAAEWPRVKTWELPPADQTLTGETLSEAIDSVRSIRVRGGVMLRGHNGRWRTVPTNPARPASTSRP